MDLYTENNLELSSRTFFCTTGTPFFLFVEIKDEFILAFFFVQVDLVEIKQEFLNRYHKTVYKMIEGDTSGDYKKLLLALVGRN